MKRTLCPICKGKGNRLELVGMGKPLRWGKSKDGLILHVYSDYRQVARFCPNCQGKGTV